MVPGNIVHVAKPWRVNAVSNILVTLRRISRLMRQGFRLSHLPYSVKLNSPPCVSVLLAEALAMAMFPATLTRKLAVTICTNEEIICRLVASYHHIIVELACALEVSLMFGVRGGSSVTTT